MTPARSLPAAGLFAGIGGLELGLRAAGHPCSLLCEIDDGARAVLRARFADTPLHDDIRTLRSLPRETRLVAAGFPCQDLSQAGQTRGISGARSGLVGEIFRLLRARPVPWVVLENVPFMLQLARGEALRVVLGQLEALGYSWAYRVVDARAFGLPQRRERVYIVASLEEDPRRVLFADEAPADPVERAPSGRSSRVRRPACGFYWTEGIRGLGWAVDCVPTLKGGSSVGVPSPPAIWMEDGAIVTPHLRDAERMQGFAPDWTLPAEQVVRSGHRWKLVGNAVSVPVATWLGGRLAAPAEPILVDAEPIADGARWPRAAWNVGAGRYANGLSVWPRREPAQSLASFLRDDPKPLSQRATAGFLERTARSSLEFPAGFLDAMRDHLLRMQSSTVADPRVA